MNCKTMVAFAAFGLLVLLTSQANAQGLVTDSFTRGQWKSDVALSVGYERYGSFYRGSEKRDTPKDMLGRVELTSVNFFGAIGLLDDLDLVVAAPLIFASGTGSAADQSGMQDVS